MRSGVEVMMFENTGQWAQLFSSIATIYNLLLHSTVGHIRMSVDIKYFQNNFMFINVRVNLSYKDLSFR